MACGRELSYYYYFWRILKLEQATSGRCRCGWSGQTEQLELRREEQRAEREKAELKKRATRDMFARSIEHARQKRDQQRHEEMVCDMKMIEQNLQGLGDEERAIQQRKVQRFHYRKSVVSNLLTGSKWPQQTWAENWGTVRPFGKGELGPHLTQCGRGLPPCQVSS